MEPTTEVLEPQNTPETVVQPAEEVVTLSKAELDALKHKADVSSQNYERLKKAEQEKEELRLQLEAGVPFNDEPDTKLREELSEIKQKLAKSEAIETYPILKEVWDEFESFRAEPENKGMNMRTAAKSFMVEKGLLEPTRKGLEKPTGGSKVPQPTGMTVDEVQKLRTNDYRKYLDMLKKGQIKV